LVPGGVDAKVLISRLNEEKDVSVQRALLWIMGELHLTKEERQNLLPRLLHLYHDDPDPGIHGAVEWLLRQWQATDQLKAIDKELATGTVAGERQWFLNRQGQTMMIVSRPDEFWMGDGPERHRRQLGRSFAIGAKEITGAQFLRFRKDHRLFKGDAPSDDGPAGGAAWCDAAAYCNWLSKQEGMAEEQWCYLPNPAGKYEAGMKMAPNYLHRTGYRLPTEAEWEYACRAGAETLFSFGEAAELLDDYAWYVGNAFARTHPVGLLKPNDLGLCDMQGNAWEWTQDAFKPYVRTEGGAVLGDAEDREDMTDINISKVRVLRGGSFADHPGVIGCAHRNWGPPLFRHDAVGFRVARTLTP
jgi:formylglycine-generating enzyme required for sulfatase activity